MSNIQDFCNLKAVKERSYKLEDCAKKQNNFQQRKLAKYLLGIEREHEGNMTMLRAKERALQKTGGTLRSRVKRMRESISLPRINLAESDGDGNGNVECVEKRKRGRDAWYEQDDMRESVIVRLLKFTSDEVTVTNDNIQSKSRHNSRPPSNSIQLPPLMRSGTYTKAEHT